MRMSDRVNDTVCGIAIGAILMFVGGIVSDQINDAGEVWLSLTDVEKWATYALAASGLLLVAWQAISIWRRRRMTDPDWEDAFSEGYAQAMSDVQTAVEVQTDKKMDARETLDGIRADIDKIAFSERQSEK